MSPSRNVLQPLAFLLERGMIFAKSPAKLRKEIPKVLEDADANLTPRMRNLLDLLWGEWKMLEQQLGGLTSRESKSPLPMPPASDYERSRHRSANIDSHCGCDWQRRCFSQGPRLRGLVVREGLGIDLRFLSELFVVFEQTWMPVNRRERESPSESRERLAIMHCEAGIKRTGTQTVPITSGLEPRCERG
jgi:hypothetical protein